MEEQSIHPHLNEREFHGKEEYEDTRHVLGVFRKSIAIAQNMKDPDRIRDYRLHKDAIMTIKTLLNFIFKIKELNDELRDKIHDQIVDGLESIENTFYYERHQTIPDEDFKYISHFLKHAKTLSLVLKHKIEYFTDAGLYFMYGKGLWMAMNIFTYYSIDQRQGLKYHLLKIKKFIDEFN